jgi:TusA-related sulfurtransferase
MGAMCPRPQLLTIKILSQIEPGEVIEVISDNPAAVESFPALMEALCCTHLLTLRDKDGWRLYLRKEPTDIFSDFILDRRN